MEKNRLTWAALFHLGRNFGGDNAGFRVGDDPVTSFGFKKMDFDEAIWREATERMANGGVNTVVLDLSEGVVYPSHPELAVEGSWSADKLRGEVVRLGNMGIEAIPKLNFSTSHDTWLGEYGRMVSTRTYYRVCREIIADVFDIFGTPRFFHIGYDEETASNQTSYLFAARLPVPREGDRKARGAGLDLERLFLGSRGRVPEADAALRAAVQLVLWEALGG